MSLFCYFRSCRGASPDGITEDMSYLPIPITDLNETLHTTLENDESGSAFVTTILDDKSPSDLDYLLKETNPSPQIYRYCVPIETEVVMDTEVDASNLRTNLLENLLYDMSYNNEVNYERLTAFMKPINGFVAYELKAKKPMSHKRSDYVNALIVSSDKSFQIKSILKRGPNLDNDGFLYINTLDKVHAGGYIINRQLHIMTRYWNCATGTSAEIFCELCKTKLFGINKRDHNLDERHLNKLRLCRPLKVFGFALVRQVTSNRYHCAICNTVSTQSMISDHVASTEHHIKFKRALMSGTKCLFNANRRLVALDTYTLCPKDPDVTTNLTGQQNSQYIAHEDTLTCNDVMTFKTSSAFPTTSETDATTTFTSNTNATAPFTFQIDASVPSTSNTNATAPFTFQIDASVPSTSNTNATAPFPLHNLSAVSSTSNTETVMKYSVNKKTLKATNRFLKIKSLHKFEDGGYVINDKVYVTQRSWNCVTWTKGSFYCEICHEENVDVKCHFETEQHRKGLKKCKHLKEFGLYLVRKMTGNRYHCAICNNVFPESYIGSHVASVEHCVNYEKAKKIGSFIVSDVYTKLVQVHPDTLCLKDLDEITKLTGQNNAKNIVSEDASNSNDATTTDFAFLSTSKTDVASPSTSKTDATALSTSKTDANVSSTSKTEATAPFTAETYATSLITTKTPSAVSSKIVSKPLKAISINEFLEIKSLDKVEGSGYIVNKQVLVFQKNWNCMTGKKGSFYCEICHEGIIDSMIRSHFANEQHMRRLKECRPLKEFRLYLIRKMKKSRYHCAICNDVFTGNCIRSHVASEEHCVKFQKAKETAFAKLSDQNTRLSQIDIPQPMPKTKKMQAPPQESQTQYLRTQLLKVRNGGIIVNATVCVPVRHWNATTGDPAAFYCSICSIGCGNTAQDNYYCHNKSDEHKGKLAKCKFIGRFEINLIRKMPNSVYHCAICNVICNIPTQHIATPAHRDALRRAKHVAAEALRDKSNYSKYFLKQ